MEEIDEKTFDVTPVMVLIRHEHDPSIAEPLLAERDVWGILLTMSETHDLQNF